MEAEEEEGKDELVGLDEDHLIQTIADIFYGKIYFRIFISRNSIVIPKS
jgi:hypothetical protein